MGKPAARPLPQISAKRAQVDAQQIKVGSKVNGRVFASLHNDLIGLTHHHQRSVRLDRARQVDLFALTIGKIRRSKSG